MTTSGALKAKAIRFAELEALDNVTGDEKLDRGVRESMSKLKRKRDVTDAAAPADNMGATHARPGTTHPEVKPARLSRTTSEPVKPTTTEVDRPHTVRRTATAVGMTSGKVAAKKGSILTSRPGLAGIFDGLSFFFFPNNDTNPARRKRIQKAQELGAVWARAFSTDVTHIVVDKSMNYGQLKVFLKVDEVPSNIFVVHEDFTADCMDAGYRVDPTLKRYHIKGYDRVQVPIKQVQQPDSLQLKPAKRDVQAREPQTPSQKTVASSSTDTHPDPAPSQNRPQLGDHASVDALSTAIEETRKMQALLIDEDEQEDLAAGLASGKPAIPSWQQKFQCMQPAAQHDDDNPNAYTISLLQQMADHYTMIQDTWRPMAYRKAINTLRRQPVRISTKEEAERLPSIGARLAQKIEEIAHTGLLQRLNSAKADPTDTIIASFMKVYGVGYATAMKFVSQGFTTLEDLRTKAKLDDCQRIGLERYEDFNTRIPRAEVAAHSAIVVEAASSIDPGLKIYTMGSYRRGASSSGDIDLIITHPTWSLAQLREMCIDTLVPGLFEQDFLKCSLARTSRVDGSKWLGASCLPDSITWRRLDLLLVPAPELGAALLYFTGNDIFNRSMRLLARKKGMRLNQRGLYKDVLRGKGAEKLTEGELVEGRDEKKIFAALGVPWLKAEDRNR